MLCIEPRRQTKEKSDGSPFPSQARTCHRAYRTLRVSLPIPAHAAGEILITQAKANAGNVTPGDNPGFPVSLTQPGSYQLAGNLTVPAGKNGVVIAAHDVTVDLNGFRIYGSNVATNGIVDQ